MTRDKEAIVPAPTSSWSWEKDQQAKQVWHDAKGKETAWERIPLDSQGSFTISQWGRLETSLKKHSVYFTVNTLTQTHACMLCLLNTFHSVVSSFSVKKTSIRFLEVLNFKTIFSRIHSWSRNLWVTVLITILSLKVGKLFIENFLQHLPEAILDLSVLYEYCGDGGQSKKESGF